MLLNRIFYWRSWIQISKNRISDCGINYDYNNCSSKEYKQLCETCCHWKGDDMVHTYGFMHTNGDLKTVSFTVKQLRWGELRACIAESEEDGYAFMGKEVWSNSTLKFPF